MGNRPQSPPARQTGYTYPDPLLDPLYERTVVDMEQHTDVWWVFQFMTTPAVYEGLHSFTRVYYANQGCNASYQDYMGNTEEVRQLDTDLSSRKSDIRAIILAHESSSMVDRKMLDLLATMYDIRPAFLRQHFDHPHIMSAWGVPAPISARMLWEVDERWQDWEIRERYESFELPSDFSTKTLRLRGDHDCISIYTPEKSLGLLPNCSHL